MRWMSVVIVLMACGGHEAEKAASGPERLSCSRKQGDDGTVFVKCFESEAKCVEHNQTTNPPPQCGWVTPIAWACHTLTLTTVPLEECLPTMSLCEEVSHGARGIPKVRAQTACKSVAAPHCFDAGGALLCYSTPGLCRWDQRMFADGAPVLVTACQPWAEHRDHR